MLLFVDMGPPQVQSRVFVRAQDGKRDFVELSWIGLEAEVASGKVGTNGRVREAAFESLEELESFIADESRKAVKKGFVEQPRGTKLSLVDEVEEEPVDEAKSIGATHQRVAWFPVVEAGQGAPRQSRFGGLPWLPLGESWPACGRCQKPLQFVLQLECVQLGVGLLQLFLCDSACQADDGWEPFAKSTFAVQRASGEGFVPDGAASYPAKAVTKWEQRPDFPSYSDLCQLVGMETALEVTETMLERRQEAAPGEKIGGWPHWIQDVVHVKCVKCGRGMSPLFQLDSNRTMQIQFGDSGIGWIFGCGSCSARTFIWQSC